MAYVYAIYHPETKSYIIDSGYYGNSNNIFCLTSKAGCEGHINTYYRHKGYRPKRFKARETMGHTK